MTAGQRSISVKAVDALIARVQRLIDSRLKSEDPLAWSVEAYYLGDIAAVAALAALAAEAAEAQIVIVRELGAPRQFVYRAWTTPELVKRWWGGRRGEVTSAEIDLRVGGRWRYLLVDEDGLRSVCHGEYREVVPNVRIVATQIDELTHAESLSTVALADTDGGTRLTLLMQLPSAAARDEAVSCGIEIDVQEQMNRLEEVAAALG